MKNTRASVRYAKSLLTLSIEKNVLDIVKADIDMICKSFDNSREISNLYLSPIIPINHKLEITNKIFKGKVNENTLILLLNLISRKRDNLIESILKKFNELYNTHKNIEESLITSTYSLDDKTLVVVKDFAEKITKKKISLVNTVDENIIGGFNLKIGDKMIDCTVSNKLNELRKKLINN
jgi:F-type H+-transporting ATPase subunit delta